MIYPSLDKFIIERVKASGSTFYWAMRLVTKERRLALYAVYVFCRDVDDCVDEERSKQDKIEMLTQWREEIDRLFTTKNPQSLIAQALLSPVEQFDLCKEDFLAIIDGCQMDLEEDIVRPSLALLDLYCDRVASAVGRLVVRILGADGQNASEIAYHQGRALQLTNILRDVKVDAKIGRLYLPDELLNHHRIKGTDLDQIMTHPSLILVCQDLALIARLHYEKARLLLQFHPDSKLKPARIMLEVYALIYQKCEKLGFNPQDIPPKISKIQKMICALRYALWN
jgi:phytoene synthase